MNKNQYVDVFLGCASIDLPQPIGIAKKWRFIKGLAGNTTPAAARPFSKITACAYSGGYAAGYGVNGINTGNPVPVILPENTIQGFSHLHMSGTGFMGVFYNYAIVSPYFGGDPTKAFEPALMTDETARPGYYATTLRDVRCELTVSDQAAHHRYTFPQAGGKLAIDFTNAGLKEKKTRMPHENLRLSIAAPDTVECSVALYGLEMHFCVRCPGATATLWEKGCVFEGLGEQARLTLGLSPRNMDFARKGAMEAEADFDAVAAEAAAKWEDAFDAIEIEADTEEEKRLFYSNFYHTLIKPADFRGESFLYDDEEAFTIDFATLWDQYKTQFPLLFTLYPDISDQIVRTILAYCRAKGCMPHELVLERCFNGETSQARMLAEHVLADAAYRGVPMDLQEVARCIRIDLMPEGRFADYKATGMSKSRAHTNDMADGCYASAVLARMANDYELASYCDELAKKWPAAFDEETGLLRSDSRFYEGNHWNYSFRLLHDMDKRIEIAGGKENYAKLLDHFFGFSIPENEKAEFEGFNNETDMETPYAYHYADRHDRISEVIHDGMKSMFGEGRGGIPGNNDSGGLSSLYMWNVMGIFPVSGQDKMIIGTPMLKSAKIRLANGNTFVIRREGEGIYVKTAALCGRELDKLELTAGEMMRGGELVLQMTQSPA